MAKRSSVVCPVDANPFFVAANFFFRGLENLGNTCYFSASIAILMSCPELDCTENCYEANDFANRWFSLRNTLQTTKSSTDCLKSLRQDLCAHWPQCASHEQQGVLECLRFILGALPPSTVRDLFVFQIIEQFTCKCGRIRDKQNHELMLCLSFPHQPNLIQVHGGSISCSHSYSLQDLIQSYLAPENVSLYCDHNDCVSSSKIKQGGFGTCGSYILIALKRFDFQQGQLKKIDDAVSDCQSVILGTGRECGRYNL